MDTTTSHPQSHPSPARALVLAGGGAAGNAWELGVIAGLCDAGIDVTAAELVVGTSAGSTVAAQITSGSRPTELCAAVLAEQPPPLRSTWTSPTERPRRVGATSSRRGCPAETGHTKRCSSPPSMPAPGGRSSSTNTAESTSSTPSPPAPRP
ncbi:patatin-like phospholipase family protein [Humibacillus xanthopallidus]|uniref:patatin-like phospholipase family protein n=1 Tax=Humibacillus xanthopallidus TaxID=412689 RepID=UPI002892F0E0|nr:patatin-like phospholipase family protein [Humibacillus xanthopallidus]